MPRWVLESTWSVPLEAMDGWADGLRRSFQEAPDILTATVESSIDEDGDDDGPTIGVPEIRIVAIAERSELAVNRAEHLASEALSDSSDQDEYGWTATEWTVERP